jgi:hypothetical protein
MQRPAQFHTGAKEARGHMQRYLGNITDGEAESCSECSATPRRSAPITRCPVSVGSRLGASELAAWRNTREGGYFIPLGALGKGDLSSASIFRSPAMAR